MGVVKRAAIIRFFVVLFWTKENNRCNSFQHHVTDNFSPNIAHSQLYAKTRMQLKQERNYFTARETVSEYQLWYAAH